MSAETMDSEECAALLRCTAEKVEELARAGDIPGLQLSRSWLFLRSDLLAYLAQRSRDEAEARRSKRQPTSVSRIADRVKPRRQPPPVLPVPLRQ